MALVQAREKVVRLWWVCDRFRRREWAPFGLIRSASFRFFETRNVAWQIESGAVHEACAAPNPIKMHTATKSQSQLSLCGALLPVIDPDPDEVLQVI